MKFLDDQINQSKNTFSPKLFSSKLIVNSIINPKKPRTLKLSDDTVIYQILKRFINCRKDFKNRSMLKFS